MAGNRPVLHLPITAAVCTGVYAISLAGVTTLQAIHEAEVTEARAPLVDAAERSRIARQSADASIREANAALQAATERYLAAVSASDALDSSLAALAQQITALSGAVNQMPRGGALPAAPGAVSAAAPPPVQGTTGASGK